MAVKIIADSVSDLPKSICEKLNIQVVPLLVNFEDASYKDGVDITPKEFFEKLASVDVLPKTSQVNPGEFIDVFKPHLEQGDDIICITMSSKLSGTYQAAVTARDFLEAEERIHILDSKGLSLGYGIIAIEAAQMVKNGLEKEAILKKMHERIKGITNIFIFDTLTYLYKGGRLSAGSSVVGSVFNVKPILTMDEEGYMKIWDKVRGRKKVITWIIRQMKESGIDFSNREVAIYHAGDPEWMETLIKSIGEHIHVGKWLRGEIGSVVGTHGGPSTMAISYFNK